MSRYYPLFFDINGKRAVVIGGGPVALRKTNSLLDAGAEVTVISPQVVPAINKLSESGRLSLKMRKYRKGDLKGAVLAVAATDEPSVNEKAASEAAALGILFNCANPPSAGNFIVPSSIKSGEITLAISTGGMSPALSKRLRLDLEQFLGDRYSRLPELLKEAKARLKGTDKDEAKRQEILRSLVDYCLSDEFEGLPPQ